MVLEELIRTIQRVGMDIFAKYHTILIFAILLPVSANAADIFIDKKFGGISYIRIEGAIEKGDFNKFKSITKDFVLTSNSYELPITINSAGGDIDEAIKIGRTARDLLASISVDGNVFRDFEGQWFYELIGETRAKDGTPFIRIPLGVPIETEHIRKCYSACVLILYGAVKRHIGDNNDQRDKGIGQNDKKVPTIGIHRPYYDKEYFKTLSPKEAKFAYAGLEVKVRNYLTEMGAPQVLIDRMFFKASNEIELIPAEEFRTFINDEEPYFEEWIISKCGSTTEGATVLSESQYRRKKEFVTRREMVFEGRVNWSIEEFKSYIPLGFTIEDEASLFGPIRAHNAKVWSCRVNAVRDNLIRTVSSWDE